MFRLDRAAAHVERRRNDGCHAQQFERQARADDIRDRIDRAHFVEMHFFDGHLVHGCFRFAQPLKHGRGVLFGAQSGSAAFSIIFRMCERCRCAVRSST
jgi:hypothetical protein